MIEVMQAAIEAVLMSPRVWGVVLAAAVYGIIVGAVPGLTATMAVALMVPLTYFLDDIEAIAAIVTTVTCSIFAGDIPATLVRIPGTPASAAYAADAYALSQAGRHKTALLSSLLFSIAGGVFGTLVLFGSAPTLARVANEFSSYEYFWLYVLGLTCAVIVSEDSVLKGVLGLLLGLLLSCVGLGTDYSLPRLTFGIDALVTGINFIPAMIGLFGLSEVLRLVLSWHDESNTTLVVQSVESYGAAFGQVRRLMGRRIVALVRSSMIGSIIGVLPGAGADIAAWISYAVSKRFSAEPERFGKGSLEGLSDATGANNAALGGAWVPALVFGIPGDSVTAIAIGVLYMKNITPGPGIFQFSSDNPQSVLVFSIFVAFLLANLMLLPVGLLAIHLGGILIRVPRNVLLPSIVLFCTVGAFSMDANYIDVLVMLAMGVLGLALERYRIPLGPVVLGIILGGPLEHRFIQCLMKSPSAIPFFEGTVSPILCAICVLLWSRHAITWALTRMHRK